MVLEEVSLKVGKMTYRELSAWFGYKKPDGFSNSSAKSKAKKLETLKSFAIYHFEGKTLYIDKVICAYYSKAFEIIEEELPHFWGCVKKEYSDEVEEQLKKKRIDTCARVGTEIHKSIPQVKSQISVKSAKEYVNRIKRKKYGRNYVNEYGTDGYSQYVWMNREGTDELDEESMNILKGCLAEAYGSVNLTLAALDDDYRHGQVSQEEYEEAKGQISSLGAYDIFIELLDERLGFIPEKRTQLVDVRQF